MPYTLQNELKEKTLMPHPMILKVHLMVRSMEFKTCVCAVGPTILPAVFNRVGAQLVLIK